jgi:hypothetical protein
MSLTNITYQFDLPPAKISGRAAIGGIELALQSWSAAAAIEFRL